MKCEIKSNKNSCLCTRMVFIVILSCVGHISGNTWYTDPVSPGTSVSGTSVYDEHLVIPHECSTYTGSTVNAINRLYTRDASDVYNFTCN